MFNLEEKIAEWRKRMAAGGVKDPAVLGELESHLREELRERLSDGDSETEAFEFAEAISEWRRQMNSSGIKAREVVEELESHLREDVERRAKSGAGEKEAFEAAVHQLGQAGALTREFAKLAKPTKPSHV